MIENNAGQSIKGFLISDNIVEFDKDTNRYIARHHPFTAPSTDNIESIEKDQGGLKSRGYDLTINGYEIAGGSIRNHKPEFQEKIFELLPRKPSQTYDSSIIMDEKTNLILK